MASDLEYESILLVKQEAFVYQIPPRTSTTRALRAADWNLPNPDWKGRMKIVSKNNECLIKLEDRSGELFAMCPVDSFPGLAVEPVSDSSRYFVLRLKDPSGRHAFVGLGFQDRGDAFDLNVTLQDHFKGLKRDQEIAKEADKPQPAVDYSLKAGQKISVNIGSKLGLQGDNKKQPSSQPVIGLSPGGILLPPPASTSRPVNPSTAKPQNDDWSDFFSASNTTNTSNTTPNSSSGGGWVQF